MGNLGLCTAASSGEVGSDFLQSRICALAVLREGGSSCPRCWLMLSRWMLLALLWC